MTGEDRRVLGVDDELEMRPAAGEAQRSPGEEQAAQPGEPAVLGGRVPVEGRERRSGVSGGAIAIVREANKEARQRRVALGTSTPPGDDRERLCGAVAG